MRQSSLAVAILLFTAPGAAALAAPVTGAEAAAELGWVRVQPPGWDFPFYVPDYGELRWPDGAARLEGNDCVWTDPAFQPNYGFASRIDAHCARLPAGSPGAADWSWLDAYTATALEQGSDATVTSRDLDLRVAGRRWLRYDFDQPDPQRPGALLHSIACVTPCSQGVATLRFYIADIELTVAYDVMLEQVLGGPLPEMNGGEGAPELEPSLPSYPAQPAVPPVEAPAPAAPPAPAPADGSGLGLAWILGADVSLLDPPLPGELPLADAWRMVAPPGWGWLLWLPGHGHLRVAGENGVSADDLGGVDFDWRDPLAPEGGVLGISGVVIPDSALLAGEGSYTDRIDGFYRRLVAEQGQSVAAARRVDYSGEEWLEYELRTPAAADSADGVERRSFTLLKAQGLDLLLVSFTCAPAAEADAVRQTVAQALRGTSGLAELVDQLGTAQ